MTAKSTIGMQEKLVTSMQSCITITTIHIHLFKHLIMQLGNECLHGMSPNCVLAVLFVFKSYISTTKVMLLHNPSWPFSPWDVPQCTWISAQKSQKFKASHWLAGYTCWCNHRFMKKWDISHFFFVSTERVNLTLLVLCLHETRFISCFVAYPCMHHKCIGLNQWKTTHHILLALQHTFHMKATPLKI